MRGTVVVQGLGKQFRRYHRDRPVTLKEAVVRGLRQMKPVEQFWALREVSCSVAAGRTIGVIGNNGASDALTRGACRCTGELARCSIWEWASIRT